MHTRRSRTATWSGQERRTIEASGRDDERVSSAIRDVGRGGPERDLPKVFRLFGQVARGAVGAPAAVFEVRLPVLSFEGRSTSARPNSLAPMARRPLRILVVDDTPQAAEALGALLELTGHTIRMAHDGAQAVEEARQFLPDIIFMDIGMPVMDGLEATRRIRSLDTAVRPYVVALTGWSSDADRRESRQAGCDVHLVKPVGYADVVAAVEQSRCALPTPS